LNSIQLLIQSRISIEIPLDQLLVKVSNHFSLGKIVDFSIERTGYEELNVRIRTSKGVFLVKIFSKLKSKSTINDYIMGMLEFRKAGIPIPKLLSSASGYLYKLEERKNTTYLCVMNYFTGKTFKHLAVAKNDVKRLTKYLTQIHALSFDIGMNYDSWGTAHLMDEYNSKSAHLSKEYVYLIEPVISEYKDINFDRFSKSIIHGDLQRTNVLRNQWQSYCILDLGVMNFSYSIIDLSIFIAHFCFDYISQKPFFNLSLYNQTIETYSLYRNLSEAELAAIPILIQATYAIYLVAANYSLENSNDYQSIAWVEFGKSGLRIPKSDLVL
jgi:Ser/Thr protein kinase RdoA (MazF antagonist)